MLNDQRLWELVEAPQPYAPEGNLAFGSRAWEDRDAYGDVDIPPLWLWM